MICLLSALNGPFLPRMRKRRTKANAERYTALSLKHCSCGTILPVRQRRLCCPCVFPLTGYSWDQAESRGEGVANCSLSGSLQPPSLQQTKVCTATGSERPGGIFRQPKLCAVFTRKQPGLNWFLELGKHKT